MDRSVYSVRTAPDQWKPLYVARKLRSFRLLVVVETMDGKCVAKAEMVRVFCFNKPVAFEVAAGVDLPAVLALVSTLNRDNGRKHKMGANAPGEGLV